MRRHYVIAEDDENTQVLIARVYKQLDPLISVDFVNDGEEAIKYLEGAGRYRDRHQFPLPAIVILDLNMPQKTGLEVLHWIRHSPLREMVVVMFSGMDIDSDVRAAYRAGVNSFVHKPSSFAELIQVLSSIHHYWFDCNYFPTDDLRRRSSTGLKVVRENAE